MNSSVRETGSTTREIKEIPRSLMWFIYLAILGFALIVLSPCLDGYFLRDDFFSWDAPTWSKFSDFPVVYEFATRWGSRFMHLGIYFSIGQGLWDHDPFKWHLANLVIFAIDTVLLFGILLRLLRDRTSALMGIGIFTLSGALFYTQYWITGSVEILASMFIFAGILCHLWALEDGTTRGQRIVRDSLGLLFLAGGLVTKETMLPIIFIWLGIDLFLKGRITNGGIGAIIVGIGGTAIGVLRPMTLQRMIDSYDVTFDPLHLLVNFAAYCLDPIMATGAEFLILHKLRMTSGASSAIAEITRLALEHPGFSIAIVLVTLAVSVFWFFYTLNPGGKRFYQPVSTTPLVPRYFGWAAWFLLLIPAIITPGHHVPYYVMVPMAFLMLAIGPALAGGFRNRKTRALVSLGLLLYVVWFPINTRLAFEYSNLAVGSNEMVQLFDTIEDALPEDHTGVQVVLNGVDTDREDAMAYSHAIEWRFPGVRAYTFPGFRQAIEAMETRDIDFSTQIIVLRYDDGAWQDVTEEFEEDIGRFAN